jgi:hypothetical protein
MHRRVEIDWALSNIPPKAVPAAQRLLFIRYFASEGNNLLGSSSALVMLPSLLTSMHARDTASAQRFSYCRYGFVLRKREAHLRC